jgi:hypothetical protein
LWNPVIASNGRILVSAKPEPFGFDLSNAAVIVVDMQNDFGAKGRLLDRSGVDISIVQKAVPPTVRVLAATVSELSILRWVIILICPTWVRAILRTASEACRVE